MQKSLKEAFNRHSDQKYYLTKVLSEKYLIENPNPVYTEEDNKKKLEIFEIPDNRTCFITGNNSNGVGDHIYEINGYYRYTNRRGVNDNWNIVPVVGSRNKSYKKIKFMMDGSTVKKDIGYQELTDEELIFLLQSENEEHLTLVETYMKIMKWKEYVERRGAVMSYEEPDNFIAIRNDFKNMYCKMWSDITTKIENLK